MTFLCRTPRNSVRKNPVLYTIDVLALILLGFAYLSVLANRLYEDFILWVPECSANYLSQKFEESISGIIYSEFNFDVEGTSSQVVYFRRSYSFRCDYRRVPNVVT